MQTPEATRPRSTTATWAADLDAYIGSHEGSPSGSSTEVRQRLVAGVKASPQSAEAWRALLAYEESHGSNMTHGLQADPGRVSLYHMYYWATTLVPRSSSKSHKEAYLQLWLGFARQQWARSPDDARDTFKTLKNQHIGDASAHLYHEWACLEHAAGNISKALGVLAKGLRADAQPSSLLEQLRAEMQSGTFDLKQAGAYTETLTLDASYAAARQLQPVDSTPAPASAAEVGAAAAGAATGTRPTSALLPGIASCLKGSSAAAVAAGAGPGLMSNAIPEHGHAARAVTFAADVHDGAAIEDHGRRHASSTAGPASVCSSRSGRPGSDGHTGCTSSSTSSRSTMSVRDGAFLPFSGATSYKSSETESSGMESTEEDTISCRAAGAIGGISSKEPGSVKRGTAPLSNHSSSTPAASLGPNTATLATGLRRFGFKSRALRVGGTAELPAAAMTSAAATTAQADQQVLASNSAAAQPTSSRPMGPPAALGALEVQAASAAATARAAALAQAGTAAAAAADEEAAAACRKRRAGQGSTPSPKTSPKLAAAYKDGQQCKVQPHESDAQAAASSGVHRPAGAAGHAAAAAGSASAPGDSGSSDDSVPLVSSKLAARLSQDRGTPRAAGKHKDEAGWPAVGNWTPPADGQLPSSLDSTPEGTTLGGTSTTFTAPTARHSSRADPSQPQQRSQQHDRGGAGSTTAGQPGSRHAAAQPCAAPEGEEDQQALPTLVLSDGPPCAAAAASQGAATGRSVARLQQEQQQQQQQQQQLQKQHVQQHRSHTSGAAVVSAAGAREPLR
ncbi:hypothetical protein COO60DRAFT_832255 [Scenedesmus sp. NREL 46B-D3]|nr:hypothetical protein COO60DRAFT_832255 [Scenedesmus sp. NREL 46B-D3]